MLRLISSIEVFENGSKISLNNIRIEGKQRHCKLKHNVAIETIFIYLIKLDYDRERHTSIDLNPHVKR